MRRLAIPAVLASVLTASLAGAQAPPAPPDSGDAKQRCPAAYEAGQKLRKEGKLVSAREQLLVCAQDACASFIRSDCALWLGEVEQSMPTVVLVAESTAGGDLVDVRVRLDGRALLEQLDGKPVAIDPGAHTIRFESPGFEPFEARVLIRDSEKSRRISAKLAPSRPVVAPVPTTTAAPVGVEPVGGDAGPARKPIPVAAWIAGGVGVLGLGLFTAFAVRGAGKESDLEACSPRCSPSRVDQVKNSYAVADVGLGIGLVSLGLAAVLVVARGYEPRPAAARALRLDVGGAPAGGWLRVGGAF